MTWECREHWGRWGSPGVSLELSRNSAPGFNWASSPFPSQDFLHLVQRSLYDRLIPSESSVLPTSRVLQTAVEARTGKMCTHCLALPWDWVQSNLHASSCYCTGALIALLWQTHICCLELFTTCLLKFLIFRQPIKNPLIFSLPYTQWRTEHFI